MQGSYKNWTERRQVMTLLTLLMVCSSILFSHAALDCVNVKVTPPMNSMVYNSTLIFPKRALRCDCCSKEPGKRSYLNFMAAKHSEVELTASRSNCVYVEHIYSKDDRPVESMTCNVNYTEVALPPIYFYDVYFRRDRTREPVQSGLTNILPLLSPDGQSVTYFNGYAIVNVGKIDFGTFPDLTKDDMKCTFDNDNLALQNLAMYQTKIKESAWWMAGIIPNDSICKKVEVLCNRKNIVQPLKTAPLKIKIPFDQFKTTGGKFGPIKCEFTVNQGPWGPLRSWNTTGVKHFKNSVSYEEVVVEYKPSVEVKVQVTGTTCEVWTFDGDELFNVTINGVVMLPENRTVDGFKSSFSTSVVAPSDSKCTACGKKGCAISKLPGMTCERLEIEKHQLGGDCSITLAGITRDSGYRDSVFKTHQYNYDISSVSRAAGGFIKTIEPEMSSTKHLRRMLVSVLSGHTPDSQVVRDIATSYKVIMAFAIIGIILAVLIVPTSIFLWRWQNRQPYKAGTQTQRRLRSVLPLTLAFIFLVLSIALWFVAIAHNSEMRAAVETAEQMVEDLQYDVDLLIENEMNSTRDYVETLEMLAEPMMENIFRGGATMMQLMGNFPHAFAAILSGMSFDAYATRSLNNTVVDTGNNLEKYYNNVTDLVLARRDAESKSSSDLTTLSQVCRQRNLSCNSGSNSDTCSCILPPLEKMDESGLNLLSLRSERIQRNMKNNLLPGFDTYMDSVMSFFDQEMIPGLVKYVKERYSKYMILFPDEEPLMPGTAPTPPMRTSQGTTPDTVTQFTTSFTQEPPFSTTTSMTVGPITETTPSTTSQRTTSVTRVTMRPVQTAQIKSSLEEMLRYYERIRWSISLGVLLISMWQVVVCVVALVLIAAYHTGHFVTCLGMRIDHLGSTCIRIALCIYLFIQFFIVVLASLHFLVGGILEKSICGYVKDTTHSAIAELIDARDGEKPVWVHALEPKMVQQLEVLDENIYEHLQVSKILSAGSQNQTIAQALDLRNIGLIEFINTEFTTFNLEEFLTKANIGWSNFTFRNENDRNNFREWKDMGNLTDIDLALREDLLNTKLNPDNVACHSCVMTQLIGINSVTNTALRANQSFVFYMHGYDYVSSLSRVALVEDRLAKLKAGSDSFQRALKELDNAFLAANENFAKNSPRIFGDVLGLKLQKLLSTGIESTLNVVDRDLIKLGNMWGIWWGVAHQYLCKQLLGNMHGLWFALGLHLLFSFATSLCAAYILLDFNQQHRGSNLHDTTHSDGIVNKGAEFEEFTNLDTMTSKGKGDEHEDSNSSLGKNSSSTSGTEVNTSKNSDVVKDNNTNDEVVNNNEPDVKYAQF